MSKREPTLYFLDIFIAYDKICRYTDRFTSPQDLLHSELEWDATIRELEIIGEATNNLLVLNLIDKKHRRIVDFRNQIIHGYFGIDEEIVFEVVKSKLAIFTKELKSLNINFEKAIPLAKNEYSQNKHILNLLNNLQKEI